MGSGRADPDSYEFFGDRSEYVSALVLGVRKGSHPDHTLYPNPLPGSEILADGMGFREGTLLPLALLHVGSIVAISAAFFFVIDLLPTRLFEY
ncbi:hypothetical protein BJF78_06545 [Pseudonocardia sp. CNS-139]|nr:hypothetical protein BJF78_06545 [Pseudonocardia sp. CNS-139]